MKPATCESCPLHKTGKGWVCPPKWAGHAPRLLVQGEAPGLNELDSGLPFVGQAGHWLRANILRNAGLDDAEVLIDNTLRCLIGGKSGGYPTLKQGRRQAEQECRQYDQWADYPTVPLELMGAKAIGLHYPTDSVAAWAGDVHLEGERVVGATYHPAAVMRELNLLPLVAQHVHNLMRAARNPKLLDRPLIHAVYDLRDMPIRPLVCGDIVTYDLEWGIHHEITVVGMMVAGVVYSTHQADVGVWMLKEGLDNGAILIGHNIISADLPTMGVEPSFKLAGQLFDTMIAAHIVHPHFAMKGLLDLQSLVCYYDPTPAWKHEKGDILRYNGLDVAYTARLAQHLQRGLQSTGQGHLLLKQQELAMLSEAMKTEGVRLDRVGILKYAQEWKAAKNELAKGFPFNPRSPKQIKEHFKAAGITLKDTEYDTIKRQAGKHPIIDQLIEYKEESKNPKTWFPLRADDNGEFIDCEEWIFPTFKVTGTEVVRFSSSGPNVQNIPDGTSRVTPVGEKTMPNLRRYIIPHDPDLWLVSYDFSQIENRILAWLAHDQVALDLFASGRDVHRWNAARIFEIAEEAVTRGERKAGKTVVHASGYCETAFHLALSLWGKTDRASVAKAKRLQDNYFKVYRATKQFQEAIAAQLDKGDLGLRNPFGRYRKIYDINSHERQKSGVHFMGCSTAAEIMNQRVIDVWRETDKKPILIVHDEAVYELPRGEEKIMQTIHQILQQPIAEMDGYVIPVKRKIGEKNYGELGEEVGL